MSSENSQPSAPSASRCYRASFIGIRRHRYIEVKSLQAACAWLEHNWKHVEEDPQIEYPNGTVRSFSALQMPEFIKSR